MDLRKTSVTVVTALLVVAMSSLASAEDKPIDVPRGQMVDVARGEIDGMKAVFEEVVQLLEKTREEDKDLLKLNCINSRLSALKGFLKVSEQSMVKLQDAVASGNSDESQQRAVHQFRLISIASDRVANLGVEAQSCVGDILRYAGETEVIKETDPAISSLDPTVIINERDDLFRLPEGTPYQ